jgi:hypothetical protein
MIHECHDYYWSGPGYWQYLHHRNVTIGELAIKKLCIAANDDRKR